MRGILRWWPSGGQQKTRRVRSETNSLVPFMYLLAAFAANSQAGETLSPGSGINWFRADSGSCCLDYPCGNSLMVEHSLAKAKRLLFFREAKLERIEQMVQLHNFFFIILFMVVPCGTAAPVLLKWFVSRDVPTGAPFTNGTIIPFPISSFPLLVYLHSRKIIRSVDGAKSGVLVRASRPILLPDIIGRSSSETRARKALFFFVPVLHFRLLESKGDFSYFESFCGVLCLLFFRTFLFLARDRSAKRERARRRKGQTLRPNGNEQRRNN
ncbi:unnamed protein product [Brassica oleracea var. botrytis]